MTDKVSEKKRDSKIFTVAGIERFLINRSPNTVECDGCGKKITPDPHRYVARDIRVSARMDFNWYCTAEHDYCPECWTSKHKVTDSKQE